MAKIKGLGTDIQAAVADIIAHYRDLAADGMSLADVWALIQRGLASVLAVLRTVQGLDKAARDAIALEAAGELFDAIAPIVDIPFVPELIETRLIDPAAREFVLRLAQGAIDALDRILDRADEDTPTPPAIPRGMIVADFQPY